MTTPPPLASWSDEIRIDGLTVTCIIGICPEERERVQPVVATVSWWLDATTAGCSGDLGASVNYAEAGQIIAMVLEAGRFQLLETAALALCSVLALPVCVQAVQVALAKPQALAGRGVPSLTVHRSRTSLFVLQGPLAADGQTQTLWPGPDAVVERLSQDDAAGSTSGSVWEGIKRPLPDSAAGHSLQLADGSRLRVRSLGASPCAS